MRNPWIAAVLNFFFMGPGTLYNGRRRALGVGLTLCALALTWIEFQVKDAAPALYPFLFGTVFVMNTFFALDGYSEAKTINASHAGSARSLRAATSGA